MTMSNKDLFLWFMVAVICVAFVFLLASVAFSVLPRGQCNQAVVNYTTLDLIKDDAYTRGHIDGRASFQAEQSGGTYKPQYLGVQVSNLPSPYPQWREYATCIARNVCYPHSDMTYKIEPTPGLPNITKTAVAWPTMNITTNTNYTVNYSFCRPLTDKQKTILENYTGKSAEGLCWTF